MPVKNTIAVTTPKATYSVLIESDDNEVMSLINSGEANGALKTLGEDLDRGKLKGNSNARIGQEGNDPNGRDLDGRHYFEWHRLT